MAVTKLHRGGVVVLPERTVKADTLKLVVNDVLTYEDDFAGLYYSDKQANAQFIEPPYNPVTLVNLTAKNNILYQCIEAMEVNIDGTGHTLEKLEGQAEESEEEKKRLEAFFDEPYPGESMLSIRRKLRRDLEGTGNAYIEIIRNAAGDLIFLRHLDATTIRLVRYDSPIKVEKSIERNGEKITATMFTRERRFVQRVGTKEIYYKEYGATRHVNRDSGKWETASEPVPPPQRGSEIFHLIVNKDVLTPYGVPRWINQIPSVLGSRKAEEANLDFFDNGTIPPVAIFLQGGALVNDVKEQLMGYFSGKSNARVAICEVQSTSGSLDSAGTVKVSVERFGDAKSGDTMYANYDKNAEEHVRVGFRLPPLFLGKAADYNFATAMTTYMVTEAQVFQPERIEFDEFVNKAIMRELKAKAYKFKSRPITLKNVDVQLKAIPLVQQMVDGKAMVTTINDIAGLNLEYSEKAVQEAKEMAMMGKATGPDSPATPRTQRMGSTGQEGSKTTEQIVSRNRPIQDSTQKEESDPVEIVELANLWAVAAGLDEGQSLMPDERDRVMKAVQNLRPSERDLFDNILATKFFVSIMDDPEGLKQIAGCCADAIH